MRPECPRGEEPTRAHFFEAAASESVPLVIYCRLCGEVRPVSDTPAPDPIPLDDLPYSAWRPRADLERRG